MQIVNPTHGTYITPRKKAFEVINPKAPARPVRVELQRDCVIWSGALGKKGDVLEFDQNDPAGHEAYSLLLQSTSGRRVPLDTPLHDSPPPIPPKPMLERFIELVSVGLNSIGDLAQELSTSKGAIARVAQEAVESGLVTINEQGLYVRTKKK
jgi:hypothetical protein